MIDFLVWGASETVGGQLFARLVKQFSDKYPRVQFHLYNETVDNINRRLDNGLVDVGLLLEPVDVTKYDFVRLSARDTWGILLRDDHPLAEREFITAEELSGYPLIMPCGRISEGRS